MYPSRVYAEINLSNLIFNIENIKKKTKTDVMAVIKADGYGHGAVECARALLEKTTDKFAVATADEAMELRQNGINGKILILGYVFPENFKELVANDVCLTVFDLDTASKLNEVAKAQNKKAKIHLKIDTGMGRIGFLPNEKSLDEIIKISKLSSIEIDGAFSHYACADSKDKGSALKQKEIFKSFTNQIEDKGIKIPIKSICNSAAIVDFDDDFFDMVRSGIVTYGLSPFDDREVDESFARPLMSLISHVVYVKEVEKDFTVSYGSTYTTSSKTKIATIPVGYADGYPRTLSNRGRVLINGRFAPIIGRVCMDQFMVDVTDIPDVQRGTKVTLIGKEGNKKISVEELAAVSGRLNYEFVCDINKRVPRIFVK